jgi:hypothetical protein
MNRSSIIINVNAFIYQLFNQSNTSFLSMWFRIIAKMHHKINNPSLAKPPRRPKEDFLIKELASATLYSCNDNIDRTCIISSSTCSSVNKMDIVNSAPPRGRSHGHLHFTSSMLNDISLNDHLPFMHKPLNMHHSRTKLFHYPFQNSVTNPNWNQSS